MIKSFVSIRQVHQAIAAKVQVPPSEIAAFRLENLPDAHTVLGIKTRTFGILGRESFLATLRYRFASAEAAMQLDQVLNNAAHFGKQLHWLDGRETGRLKVNPRAANDVLPALVDLGKHFSRCRDEHLAGNHILDQKLRSLWDRLDPRRLDEIGFIAEQIAPILDEAGIAHSLTLGVVGNAPVAKSDSSVQVADEPVSPQETHAAARVYRMASAGMAFDDLFSQIVERVVKDFEWIKGRRGNQARLAQAVWLALKAAADQEDGTRPTCLFRYEKPSDCVQYLGYTGKQEINTERVRGRLRRGKVFDRFMSAS